MQPLSYPFGRDELRTAGDLIPVAEGVQWLRMPLPMKMDHINLWLLDDEFEQPDGSRIAGYTLVDTGMNARACRETWDRLFDEGQIDKPIKRMIVTHMHPDHIGLAGWLAERTGAKLWITSDEYNVCQHMMELAGAGFTQSHADHFTRLGFDVDNLAALRGKSPGGFSKMVSELPKIHQVLEDNQEIQIGQRTWRVVTGNGHSPDHACLWCPELKVFITGDQVLPRITSNVSVYPNAPEQNPLKNWLDSCRKLSLVADDVLVLPSHQTPFYGLHQRLQELIAHHEIDLKKLRDFLSEPRTALSSLPVLFNKEISGSVFFLAVGELVAHLNYLLNEGLIRRELTSDNLYMYQAATADGES